MSRPQDIPLNTIIQGDNVQVLKTFPDECIDLTVTSPPYDKLRDYKGYEFNFKDLAKELYRVTKKGGVVVWVIGDSVVKGSETGSSFKQALYFKENAGFRLHDTMIYEKHAFAFPSKNRYHQIFEYMFVLSKGTPKTFNPIEDKVNKSYIKGYTFGKKRRKKDGSMSHEDDTSRIKVPQFGKRFNIWRYITGKGNTTADECAYDHPAVFPESLAQDHIKSWSDEGDIVLDPMVGAGTTSKMAYIMNRKFIGIDISEEYCKIAMERLNIAKKIILENKKEASDFFFHKFN